MMLWAVVTWIISPRSGPLRFERCNKSTGERIILRDLKRVITKTAPKGDEEEAQRVMLLIRAVT